MSGEPRKRLGELLLDAGVIDAAQLQAALGHQRQWGARLGQALVDLKLVAESDIVQALSRKCGYEVARLDALQPHALQQALRLVPREFAVRNNVLPIAADTGSITVAMSDPTNLSVVDELRFRTGRRVRIFVGGDREIAGAVRRHYPSEQVLEAIALDLDADDGPGEQVLDPFGGGSKDALEAFFGSGPAPRVPAPPARAPGPAPRPPGPGAVRAASPAPGPAIPGGARPAPPGPAPRASGADLELEDPRARSEAVERARAELLGAAPSGGLAAEEPDHAAPVVARAEAGQQPPAPPSRQAQPAPARGTQLTQSEREVLDALDRLAGGAHAEPELLKPAQAMAAIIRLLIRRGVVSEREFLDELLGRSSGG